MAEGDLEDFASIVAPGALNHEDRVEPPACRVGGPAGFHASAQWLRGAFADLHYEAEHVVVQDDLVVVDATMTGRHVGDFILHDAQGKPERAYAPTGQTFAVRQTHWFRVPDSLITEQWAVRDDLGQSLQLGWVPPTPLYVLRCARALRGARRDAASSPRWAIA